MEWKKFKQKVDAKATELKTKAHIYYIQHEAEIWATGAVIIPAAAGIAKAISKSYTARKDEQHRKMEQYDPATGYYNQLRRPLTPNDWNQIMQMKRELGITLTECLINLNLVK